MQIRFGVEAQAELNEAVLWYAERSTGVASAMLDEVEHLVRVLPDWPKSHPILRTPGTTRELRRALLQTFPYALVYTILAADIQVVALAHLKRAPLYWIARLGEL